MERPISVGRDIIEQRGIGKEVLICSMVKLCQVATFFPTVTRGTTRFIPERGGDRTIRKK